MPDGGAELHLVDVFTRRPLAGNPLAVVICDAFPPPARMQAIARETGFSETTFVLRGALGGGGFAVRIFTPVEELPFAGHPTLGTAWVVREHLLPERAGAVTLALGVGPVEVVFDGPDEAAMAWLQAPPVRRLATCEPSEGAALLGCPADAIDSWMPVHVADVGPRFLLVPVIDDEVLARLGPGPFAERLRSLEATGVFAVRREAAEGPYAARMFFEADGPREDPATGSAAACLGSALAELGLRGRFRLEQGREMGRPALIELDVADDAIRVGGAVRAFAEGRLIDLDSG